MQFPTHYTGTRLVRSVVPALAVTATMILAGCGEDTPVPTDPLGDAADLTPPTVTSVRPAAGATAVDVGSSIEVSFSEPIDPATVTLSALRVDGVPGIVQASGDGLRLEPSADLEYATTYSATVGASVTDLAGNVIAAPHSWTFTTEPAPAPPFSLSITPGQLWVYDVAWSRTVVGSSIGVDEEVFEGWALLSAQEQIQWQGREAWRIVQYDVETQPGQNAFDRSVLHLHQDSGGFLQWVGTATNGSWERLLSTQVSSFSDNHMLLAGHPRGPTTEMGVGQVSVPAGSFTTLRARVEHTVTGPYVPEDIFETRVEDWADGVGVVRASWNFSFDDNDPSGWDVFESGTMELMAAGTGPTVVDAEAEPNDAPVAKDTRPLGLARIVEGEVHISDPGSLVTDPNVHANALGDARIQDWYRLEIPAGGATIRIDLDFDRFTNGAFNDLDLYMMAPSTAGIAYVASSTAAPGEKEWLAGFLPGGTYYVGVQAWSTPTIPVGYGLMVR